MKVFPVHILGITKEIHILLQIYKFFNTSILAYSSDFRAIFYIFYT